MSDFCHHEERKARKIHLCVECRGSILIGELYHYYSGAWEGRGFSEKRCATCDDIYHRYISESNCMDDERPALGDLRRELVESDLFDLQRAFEENKIKRNGGAT